MAAPYTHLAGANDGRGILPLLLWRLTVTHILRRQEVNPKGIRSLSPATVLIVNAVHAAFSPSVCAPAVSEGSALMQ